MVLHRLPRLAVIATFAVALAGCQYNTPEGLLFGPTYDDAYVPQTYNTPYDCRGFQGGGYRGTVAGKVFDFDRTRNASRVACFRTQSECQAFLGGMSGYIDQIIYSRCQPV